MKFTGAIAIAILATSAAAVPWCGYKGQPCGKRDAIPAPIPEPEPEAIPEATQWGKFKGNKGQPFGKRDAEPEAEAAPEAEPWCGYKGQPCGKKV